MTEKLKNKKIKICFISLKAYQLFNQKIETTFGGAEVQLSFLAKELAKDKNFEVSFVVGDFGQPKKEKINKVNLRRFYNFENSKIFKKIWIFFKYFFLLKKINADVYFTTTANPSVGATSFFCKLKNKKHIHRTASDIDVNREFIKKNGLNGRNYKYGLEKSDVIVVQNEEHQKSLMKNHKINSIIIKNSFNFDKNIVFSKNFILWVSRCHPLKKPELFLNLAEKFPQEKFIITCPPSEGFQDFFKKIKIRAEKIKNVEFIDFVPFDKIQKYYNEAKIFVNTSDYEGFPNTFIQSCIGETPIISLRVNPDNFLNKYNCGYCADGDFDKLVQQTETLLKNKKDWKEKSRNARKYVEENHDIRKNIVDLKKIIGNL